ncbi:UDP-2,4-diacetamido-2,4,6-trideoxy-beta-L-altropyranose hydrolase [Clostridium estertheticum]|uniref:UDP-2,4-diacetamido-2,4, 6-trideoxy-beta-L-altropyranose hydrolase n=1 Tax=Clostridium estertheticum TaxID=238834 RepID=UPI001C0E0E4F|nr:UDP-2,4-diacetamido-2,4,6-trideoxy-beta-L-altropyranose hydrolase [Clostridium estertheticum]MBU3074171.1 UDP-2,4-diacetamido-2,4,6-trideoxy-beta-L-altropyranose hydrolase [Clostridium estertheticum]MBU3164265.1 UDP-2,4-diacetamido-2,4,6-trideoxy-beta-L-altropyranose hydrolase [Clostridium estertheticum]
MKIAIRADGGANIGMGHIMRTLVIAKEFSKINDVFYICRVDNPLSEKYRIGIEMIKSQGFVVMEIREEFMLLDIKDIQADLLITDSYDVDERYFNETKKMFNQTVYIDDMNLYCFNVDFLINQNVDAADFEYKVNPNTKLLIGPTYIMLREEFRVNSKKYVKINVNDIMITVGGGDPQHVTEQLLEYVERLEYNFHVIVGPSFDGKGFLKNFKSPKISFYYNANMYEIMKKCDIAISACGSTLYELATCGIATLGIIVAENQQGIAAKLSEMGIIKNIGWYDKLDKDMFVSELNNLCNDYGERKEINRRGKEVIDGSGVKRIVENLIRKI